MRIFYQARIQKSKKILERFGLEHKTDPVALPAFHRSSAGYGK
jgi:hypothetical protein